MASVNNSTNVTISEDDIGGRRLVTFLSLFGLSLEFLVLYIVFKQKGLKLSAFNTFLVCVMSAEIICFFLYLGYAVPCVISGTQIYGPLMGDILGNFETADFLALVGATFFISVNRALSVSGNRVVYQYVFTPRLCVVYCVCSWVVAAIDVGIDVSLNCRTAFLEKLYFFAEICDGQPPELTATSLTIYVGVYCVALVYGYALYNMFRQHRAISSTNQQLHDNMGRRKRLLFCQAFCIWFFLFISVISFRVIPALLSGLAAVLLTAFIVLATNFMSPLCMLIFSSETRRAAKNIFLCRDINYDEANNTQTDMKQRTPKISSSVASKKNQVTPLEDC